MAPTIPHPFGDPDRMSAEDERAVVTQALALQRAARVGPPQAWLRGKNFGLLCESEAATGEAAMFRRAAMELGAHVAHIRASLSEFSTPQEVEYTARLLGRLYDAVECQGMPSALVQQVGQAVDMPVYDAVASQRHPTARLADQLGSESPAKDRRRFVLQAVLIGSLG